MGEMREGRKNEGGKERGREGAEMDVAGIIVICTFAVCSMVTTTFVRGLDTRSMAPPIPFTILPCTHTHTHTHTHTRAWKSSIRTLVWTHWDHPVG